MSAVCSLLQRVRWLAPAAEGGSTWPLVPPGLVLRGRAPAGGSEGYRVTSWVLSSDWVLAQCSVFSTLHYNIIITTLNCGLSLFTFCRGHHCSVAAAAVTSLSPVSPCQCGRANSVWSPASPHVRGFFTALSAVLIFSIKFR